MSKRIKKELRRRIKDRSQNYYVNPKRTKLFKTLGIIGVLSLIINLMIIAYQYNRGSYVDAYDFLIRLSFTVFTFCYSSYLYLMGLSPVARGKNFDLENWIFSIELKKRIIKFIASICLLVLSSFLFFRLDLNKGYSSLIAFVGSINYLLYNFIIIYVIHNPKQILNSFLTGIGSGMKLLSYSLVIIGIRGIIAFCVIENFFLMMVMLFVIGLAAHIVMEYDRQYILLFGKGLDYVQLKAVKIIKSINLVSVIEKDNKMLKNKKQAIELLQKMKESNDYGVMLEFSELIKKDRGSSFIWLWGFVSIVVIFVISSVLEGITQDLLKDTVKDFLCKSIGVLCEN